MSITYTSTNGLFTKAGKVVKAVNARVTTAGTDLPAELAYVQAVFSAGSRDDQVVSLPGDYQGFQDQQVAVRQRVAGYADVVFNDRVEVLAQLGLTRGGLTRDFWEAFLRQMAADSQSVLKSTVTLGSTTPNGANTGTGTVLTTLLLDGFNAPTRGGPALRRNAGLTSQLGVASETMLWECVTDAGTGATAGQEVLSWNGGIRFAPFDWRGEGSGQGPSLSLAGDGGLLDNGSLDDWSGTVPVSWDIDAGGTGVAKTTDTVRGANAAIFTGDGALANIQIGQAVADKLDPLRMYCLSLRLKASAAVGAGDFVAKLSGTGYTEGGTEKISVAHGSLPTSYTLESCFILTPASIPTDLRLILSWSGTPTNAKVIKIDCVALQPVVYHGGLGAVAVPGATDAIRGDRWTATVANDEAGKWQQFARRRYGVQFPSVTSGETVANSLCT